MADLPFTECVKSAPQQGYRARYECVSYLGRAVGDCANSPQVKGRLWHAEFRVPEGAQFAEFDFSVTLPPSLAWRFRMTNIKSETTTSASAAQSYYSFTFCGAASYGNCKPGNEACLIQKAFRATLFYK